MRRKRAILLTLLLLAGLVAACSLWLRSLQRQYALNRALIAAVMKWDDNRAIMLVNEGADPNARFKPIPDPSLPELVKQLFHRSRVPANESPTALMFACGANWSETGHPEPGSYMAHCSPQLVEAMLAHGADANMTGVFSETPLFQAISNDALFPRVYFYTPRGNVVARNVADPIVRLLLKYGAHVNARGFGGATPLMDASSDLVDPATMDLLLAYGADVNAQDLFGDTALHRAIVPYVQGPREEELIKAVVHQLLTHGANPSVRNKLGITPLKLAQQHKYSSVVALLRHYGAKQ